MAADWVADKILIIASLAVPPFYSFEQAVPDRISSFEDSVNATFLLRYMFVRGLSVCTVPALPAIAPANY